MGKEKIRVCYERLQKITIQATVENMEALLQTLYDLRDEYQKGDEPEDAADLERRDDH